MMYVVTWIHCYPLCLVYLLVVSPLKIVDVIPVSLICCSYDCPRWVWEVPHQLPPRHDSLVVKIVLPLPVSLFSYFFGCPFWLQGTYFVGVSFTGSFYV